MKKIILGILFILGSLSAYAGEDDPRQLVSCSDAPGMNPIHVDITWYPQGNDEHPDRSGDYATVFIPYQMDPITIKVKREDTPDGFSYFSEGEFLRLDVTVLKGRPRSGIVTLKNNSTTPRKVLCGNDA